MDDRAIFMAALLYSSSKIEDERTKNLFGEILDKISRDSILKSSISKINIDSIDVRSHLMYNRVGAKIRSWPIFLLRLPDSRTPRQYFLSEHEEVFRIVREMKAEFDRTQENLKKSGQDISIVVNIDNGPEELFVYPGSLIKFVSANPHSLHQTNASFQFIEKTSPPVQNFSKVLKFLKPGTRYFASVTDPAEFRYTVNVSSDNTEYSIVQ